MSSLEVGEKYLSIKMDASQTLKLVLEAIRDNKEHVMFAAFKNDKKTESKHPSFVTKGCGVWIMSKKMPVVEETIGVTQSELDAL